VMETAIPKPLQCPRTRRRRIPDDYAPPYPSTVARYRSDLKRVVMAYFGVQYRVHSGHHAVSLVQLSAKAFGSEGGPRHWDRAQYIDEAGFSNIITIGYWDEPSTFDTWFGKHGATWANGTNAHAEVGTFCEVLKPAIERFETLFSSDVREGVACMAEGLRGTSRTAGPRADTEPQAARREPLRIVVPDHQPGRLGPHDLAACPQELAQEPGKVGRGSVRPAPGGAQPPPVGTVPVPIHGFRIAAPRFGRGASRLVSAGVSENCAETFMLRMRPSVG